MKIFQIVTLSELGGAQSVLVNLSNAFSNEHEVTVIAGEGDGKMFGMLNSGIKHIKIDFLKKKVSPINDLRTVFLLIYYYCKYKPDIIHLHSSKAGILGRLIFPRNKIIYTVHGFDSIRLAYKKYLPIERLLQNNCKAIVVVSHYDENNLKSEHITHNIKCVYNGCKQVSDKTAIFSIPQKYKKKILCIARISKPKRFHTFLEIASILFEYAFIWIGNQETIQNLPENVFCLGNLPNASIYNQFIDLFILPTNYEGLPIVIIEAMSYGKPIVASNVGGISEIVVNDDNGYTVENITAVFAEKIKYILENEDIYLKFSENSLRRYYEMLTLEKMVQRYKEIYQS
jgi:glycosyltransferase involved in cell wall biosynthesis